MSTLTSNTAALEQLLEKVNTLPEAGGGGAVETCEVYIESNIFSGTTFFMMEQEGAIVPWNENAYFTGTYTVPKNSLIVVASQSWNNYSTDGEVEAYMESEDYNAISFWVIGSGEIIVS